MPDVIKQTVTRTVTLSDLTPVELASIFAAYDSEQQATFFTALRAETKDWPGTGWCGQSWHIADAADYDALFVIMTLAGHCKPKADEKGIVV